MIPYVWHPVPLRWGSQEDLYRPLPVFTFWYCTLGVRVSRGECSEWLCLLVVTAAECLLCLMQRLKTDLMEGFERQLQELIDDFVQEVEDADQIPSCNGPTKSFKLVTFWKYHPTYWTLLSALTFLSVIIIIIIVIIIIRQFIRPRNMSIKSLQGRRTACDTNLCWIIWLDKWVVSRFLKVVTDEAVGMWHAVLGTNYLLSSYNYLPTTCLEK